MFGMFRQLFAALSAFCVGLEKIGQSFVNLTTIGEEMSGTYLDETRAQRKDQLTKLAAASKRLEELEAANNVTDVVAK